MLPNVSSWTLTLIEREDDTRSWSNFSGLFLTQCHTNLRGWDYIFIASQLRCCPKMLSSKMLQLAYAKMLV
jgi:hypothetical protein